MAKIIIIIIIIIIVLGLHAANGWTGMQFVVCKDGNISVYEYSTLKYALMKKAVIWDVTPCGSCKNRCFEGTWRLHQQVGKNWRAKNNVSNN
jgi:hypothetical protein